MSNYFQNPFRRGMIEADDVPKGSANGMDKTGSPGKQPDEYYTVVARCAKCKKAFSIQLEPRPNGGYNMTATRPLTGGDSQAGGHGRSIEIKSLHTGSLYHCPFCGNQSVMKCFTCGNLTCLTTGKKEETCAWCSRKGKIGGSIRELSVTGSSGVKYGDKAGLKGDK